MAETNTRAAVYRYFTADLLSNEILAEIPFQGVSYERAIKGAGRFGGSIAVNPQTEPLDLYNSTMPGNTALFVVRDGVCVWGGIIWQRDYDIVGRTLQISGNEFTSYFYHRRIWKTWNHEYGATLTVDDAGLGTVSLDYGTTEPLKIGESVYISFPSATDIKYNNYYKVGNQVTPTTDTFTLESVATVTDITKISRSSNTVTYQTDGYHHLQQGDLVDISVDLFSDFSGKFTVASVIDSANNLFTVQIAGTNLDETDVTGTVSRSISAGSYYGLTVTTSTDTYDYIRKLIDAVMNDFSGIAFPNTYIEPGITYSLDVVKKEIGSTIATITTSVDHKLAEGQNVRLENIDSVLNGEHTVLRTPTPKTFTFRQSGTLSETSVAVKTADITKVSATGSVLNTDGSVNLGKITMTTNAAHNFSVGDYVEVTTPLGYQFGTKIPNGVYKITDITNGDTHTFSYINASGQAIPETTLGVAQATVGATSFDVASAFITSDKITITTAKPHTFSDTDTVTVSGASPYHGIKSRSIDYFPQTTTVGISSISRTSNTVTVNTKAPHGLSQYEKINVVGANGDLNGTGITVASVTDSDTFTYTTVASGSSSASTGTIEKYPVATITALGEHHLDPGDTITVSGISEAVPIQSVQYEVSGNQTGATITNSSQTKHTVTLTTSAAHGFESGNKITVSGSGNSTFNGTYEVKSVPSSTSLTYDINGKATIASASDTGTIKGFAYATITTSAPHNFKRGTAVTLSGLVDSYRISKRQRTNGVVTLTTTTNHNVDAGDKITVSNIYEELACTQKRIIEGIATLTVANNMGLAVNDQVSVRGLTETYTVSYAARKKNVITLTISGAHNVSVGDTITIPNLAKKFYGPDGERGEKNVTSVVGQDITFEFASSPSKAQKDVTIAKTSEDATVTKKTSLFDGDKTITAVTPTSISYSVGDPNVIKNIPLQAQNGTLKYLSPMNGTYTVASTPTAKTLTYSQGNVGGDDDLALGDVLRQNDSAEAPYATLTDESSLAGSVTVYSVDSNIKFKVDIGGLGLRSREDSQVSGGFASAALSVFNGTHRVVSVPTDDPTSLTFSATRDLNGVSVFQQSVNNYAYFQPIDLFNVTSFSIDEVVEADNSFTVTRAHSDVPVYSIAGKGTAVVRPVAITSTYGGFPGNSDIGIDFSTRGYSGVNVKPTLYRGFELVSVGEALDKYSDSIDGFEYRIDCEFNQETQTFKKTFVLIPINYPDPPEAGQVSPLSRFGADQFVFEYPGNIANVTINESAENSTTRFFTVGSNSAGSDVGANYSAASDTQLLTADSFGRKWPLLEDDEKVDNTDDKNVLYDYAKKYMTEVRPPDAEINISVNGSLEPKVGTYAPGDWCAIVIDDAFVRARLATDLEPRDNVLVRKIESYSVSVPDGVTFPEKVTLKVVPEWEVDKRG